MASSARVTPSAKKATIQPMVTFTSAYQWRPRDDGLRSLDPLDSRSPSGSLGRSMRHHDLPRYRPRPHAAGRNRHRNPSSDWTVAGNVRSVRVVPVFRVQVLPSAQRMPARGPQDQAVGASAGVSCFPQVLRGSSRNLFRDHPKVFPVSIWIPVQSQKRNC
jgi:hypothetical protein